VFFYGIYEADTRQMVITTFISRIGQHTHDHNRPNTDWCW